MWVPWACVAVVRSAAVWVCRARVRQQRALRCRPRAEAERALRGACISHPAYRYHVSHTAARWRHSSGGDGGSAGVWYVFHRIRARRCIHHSSLSLFIFSSCPQSLFMSSFLSPCLFAMAPAAAYEPRVRSLLRWGGCVCSLPACLHGRLLRPWNVVYTHHAHQTHHPSVGHIHSVEYNMYTMYGVTT